MIATLDELALATSICLLGRGGVLSQPATKIGSAEIVEKQIFHEKASRRKIFTVIVSKPD